MAKKTKYDLVVPPRFLYRYRPLHDEFSSIQQMLERDRWWFGSRTTLMEAPDQGLASHREAVDPSGRRPRGAVSRVDVQEEVLTIQPADSRALGQPLSPPRIACGPARAPAPSSGIVWSAAVARGDVRPPRSDCGAQQREKTIDRIGFPLRL